MSSNSSDVAKSQAEAIYKKALELRDNAKTDDELKKAFKMLLNAADNGYAPAQFTVGKLYEEMDTEFSMERAKKLYFASAAQGYPEGIAEALLYLESLPLETQAQYFKKALALDHPAILSSLAILYRMGVPELKIAKNKSKCLQLEQRAADLGSSLGYMAVASRASMSSDFLNTDPKLEGQQMNDAKALEYYTKAAELNERGAIEILIKKYEQRSSSLPNHILKSKELQDLRNKLNNLNAMKEREKRLFLELIKELGLDKVSEHKPQVLTAYQASSNSKGEASAAVSNSPEQAQDTKTDKNKPKKTS